MSNIRPPEEVLRKPVACWLTDRDYDRLMVAAESYGIRVAVYIRAVLVDALADEDERRASKPVVVGKPQDCHLHTPPS